MLIFSCNQEKNEVESLQIDLSVYHNLSSKMRNDLNEITTSLRNQNISNNANLAQIAENYYGSGTEYFEIFKSTFEDLSSKNGRITSSGELTKFQ